MDPLSPGSCAWCTRARMFRLCPNNRTDLFYMPQADGRQRKWHCMPGGIPVCHDCGLICLPMHIFNCHFLVPVDSSLLPIHVPHLGKYMNKCWGGLQVICCIGWCQRYLRHILWNWVVHWCCLLCAPCIMIRLSGKAGGTCIVMLYSPKNSCWDHDFHPTILCWVHSWVQQHMRASFPWTMIGQVKWLLVHG